MSRFLNVPGFRPYGDGENWCMLDKMVFEFGLLGSGVLFETPQFLITDFASVPHIFWNILPPWGKYGLAVVQHDWMYYDQKLTRDECDEILYEAMKALGVSDIERDVIFDGVRCGGTGAWETNKKKKDTGFIRIAQAPPMLPSDLPFYWEGSSGNWKEG